MMSGRAARLLRKFAIGTGVDMKKVKKMWKNMTMDQRTEFRRRVEAAG